MHKIIISFFIIIILTSCKSKCERAMIGQWKVCHIIYKGKEILKNDLMKNGYEIPFEDSGILYLNPGELIYRSNKWELRDILVKAKTNFIIKDNLCFIEINSEDDETFNGVFQINETFENIVVSNVQYSERRIILKSKDCNIYMTMHSRL